MKMGIPMAIITIIIIIIILETTLHDMVNCSRLIEAAAASAEASDSDPIHPRKPYLHRLHYYLHLEDPGYVTAADSGHTSDMSSYSTEVFDLPMTRQMSRSSDSLGVVRGLSVIVDGKSVPSVAGHRLEELLNTILYDDGLYSGTIVQHGVYDLSVVYRDPIAMSGPGGADAGSTMTTTKKKIPGGSGVEMAVVGGTGDFRCANGYSLVSLASPPPQTILKWEVFLHYPCRDF